MSGRIQKQVILYILQKHGEKIGDDGSISKHHEEIIAKELKKQFNLPSPVPKIIKDFL